MARRDPFFRLPFLLAIPYVPRATTAIGFLGIFFFVSAGLSSYLFPIDHSNGVGVWAFYLVPILVYLLVWTCRGVKIKNRMPVGPILCLGFLSVVIPDAFLTYQRFGTNGTVGGMGIKDGLILFWLLPSPVVFYLFIGSEWVLARDEEKPFSWKEGVPNFV